MRSTPTLLALSLALASCGGGSSTETTSRPTGGGDTGGGETTATQDTRAATDIPALPSDIAGPPTPWDSMTPEQKGHWMAEHVMPTMEPLFQAYDSGEYATFECTTCHGENARAEHFHMPSASLPVLPATPAEWQQMQTDHPRAMAFMSQDVEHAMAALVGEAPFDPATHEGFGCGNCHTTRAAAN